MIKRAWHIRCLNNYANEIKLITYYQFYRCGVEKYIHHPEIFQSIVKTSYHPFISNCGDWDRTLYVQWTSRQILTKNSSYNYQYMVGLQFTANFPDYDCLEYKLILITNLRVITYYRNCNFTGVQWQDTIANRKWNR